MKSAFALVAVVALGLVACGGEETPAPAVPAAPATPPPAPPPAAPADTTPPPAAPAKQLITVTTKSPDAKTAFMAAWDLRDNGRDEEALDQCRKAVAADPDFAFGHSCIGDITSGQAGQVELDQGAKLAASLPDAERLTIEAAAARRRQDSATYYADVKRAAELAPDDFHAQLGLGWAMVDKRDFTGAATVFQKALDLNPGAAFVNGALTFCHTQNREYDAAVASARKYVDGAPDQSAAHRTLGYALVENGKPKGAEPEFAKAVDLAPKSRWAYYDLATIKSINGDFAGARDVLDRSKSAEVQPTDALDRVDMTALAFLGEGKNADAFKLLDATEKDSDAKKLPWPAQQARMRGWAYFMLGKPGDAIKAADAGMARCDHPESSVAYKANCRREMLLIKGLAQLQAGKVADAKKTVATLQDEAKNWQGNDWVLSGIAVASDLATALAAKDGKAAAAVAAKCPPDDLYLRLAVMRQAEKSGDKDDAAQMRKDLVARPVQDMAYPLVVKVVARK